MKSSILGRIVFWKEPIWVCPLSNFSLKSMEQNLNRLFRFDKNSSSVGELQRTVCFARIWIRFNSIGRSTGCGHQGRTLWVQFFSFSSSFWRKLAKIIGWCPHLCGWHPLLRKILDPSLHLVTVQGQNKFFPVVSFFCFLTIHGPALNWIKKTPSIDHRSIVKN